MSVGPPPPVVTLPVEPRLMHSHNFQFQAQLRTMHWLVDQIKRLPGGYTVLEQVLSTSTTKPAEQAQPDAAAGRSKRRSIYKGPIATPETGCEHGEVYHKNLCKSCWERYKRSVKGAAPGEQKSTVSATTGEKVSGESDLESGVDSGDEYKSMGAGGQRKRLAVDDDEDGIASAYRSRPKKAKDLCGVCMQRPILCKFQCSQCYQKSYKLRKEARERGLPEPPPPSLVILEARARQATEMQRNGTLWPGHNGVPLGEPTLEDISALMMMQPYPGMPGAPADK